VFGSWSLAGLHSIEGPEVLHEWVAFPFVLSDELSATGVAMMFDEDGFATGRFYMPAGHYEVSFGAQLQTAGSKRLLGLCRGLKSGTSCEFIDKSFISCKANHFSSTTVSIHVAADQFVQLSLRVAVGVSTNLGDLSEDLNEFSNAAHISFAQLDKDHTA